MKEFDEAKVSEKIQEAILKVLEQSMDRSSFEAIINGTEIEGMVRYQANDLASAVLEELDEL